MRTATIDPEMQQIILEHLDIVRKDAIGALLDAINAVERFQEIAAEASRERITAPPGVTLRKTAGQLIEKLVSIDAGEFTL